VASHTSSVEVDEMTDEEAEVADLVETTDEVEVVDVFRVVDEAVDEVVAAPPGTHWLYHSLE
jgi:hypothetical protein